ADSNDIDDKCIKVDETKIEKGMKEVHWETIFDHSDESLDLLHEDFLHRSDGNEEAKSNDIDVQCMEVEKTKIGEGTKDVD
ncbi:hypothetical protein Ancab_001365, partial [Ancistrocladus abbreviatus]